MQEEFKTKIKRTAKKIVALGASALMAGATLGTAAVAADLSGLPGPVIADGVFDAYVIVGTQAATITAETLKDVAGAIEVATAFGQLATTSTGSEGSATLQVRQFTGENLGAMYVDTTVTNTYHEDVTWSALGASSELTALNDVPFTLSSGVVKNATIELTIDDDYVEVDRDTLALHINASTDTINVVQINLSTNRTDDYTYAEGDSLNWFGELFEIVDVLTDGNVSLGSTSEVTAEKGEAFTIGGETFTFESASDSSNQASILDASGTRHFINTTYTTIGQIQLRIKSGSIYVSDVITSATFETVTNSYKFEVGDAWPLDTTFIVDAMTNDGDVGVINSSIILRNNVTYDLSAKGAEDAIVEALNFIYSDNTDDETAALALVTYGGTGQINITEAAGVTLALNTSADGTGSPGWRAVALSLPGVDFYRYSGDVAYTISAFADEDTYVVYGVNNGTNKIEFKLNMTALGTNVQNATWARPQTEGSLSFGATPGSVSWTAPSFSGTYTTPSGIFVNASCCAAGNNNTLELQVAAVRIDIDSSTYYGRKNSDWTEPRYSAYGTKVNWASPSSGDTGTVSAMEPTGDTLAVTVTFQPDDDAIFAQKSDINFDSATVTATGNATGTDQDSDFGSHIGFLCSSCTGQAAGDPIEQSSPGVDDTVAMTTPRKDLSLGVGALQDVEIDLDTDEDTATPVNSTIGNTTVTLVSGAGSAASINKISPGIAKFDTDSEVQSDVLAKPVVLVGGSAINGLVAALRDGGLIDYTDLIAQGSGHAQVDLVENAFNSQPALAIAGYGGDDTLMAARAVAGALLSGQPFDFADHEVMSLILNTGTTVVSEVSVLASEEPEGNETE
jgi:hypothetical protein